ncbi:MAG: polysaccharide deacetylase family protein [Clostridia bacterium]
MKKDIKNDIKNTFKNDIKSNTNKNNLFVLLFVIFSLISIYITYYIYLNFSTPKIQLIGNSEIKINAFEEYIDNGAISTLNNKKNNVKVLESNVDTKKIGIYNITYGAVNKKNKKLVTVTRKVIVIDKKSPVITLNGNEQINIYLNDIYTDLGVKAIDDIDGDITNKVIIKNTVNTSALGNYTVTYTVLDSSLNASTIERNVNVITKTKEDITKTIYLTFDDGPSNITESLLDMLKKYNVKATFFVVGKNINDYTNIVKRASDEGHVVAVHCYDHNYSEVYKSDIIFFDQLKKTENIIYNITGKDNKLFRFPGGSSNTVSKKYNLGIMSRITKETTNKGYIYFDWNIDSMDSTKKLSGNEIYNNLVNGLNVKSNTVVVLCHDSVNKSTTIMGVEMFINYCKNRGYNFNVITNTTPYIKHRVVN